MVVELIVIAVVAFVAALAAAGFLLKRRYANIMEESVGEVDEVIDSGDVSEAADDVGSVRNVAGEVSDSEVVESEKPGSEGVGASSKKKSSRSRKRRSISRSLERKIIAMYKAGKSPKEIAEALGISTSSVYRRVRNALKS